MSIPKSIDKAVLRSYLHDHLAGATAGVSRAQKMADWYGDTPIGARLKQVAGDLVGDRDELKRLIDQVGLPQPTLMKALGKAGEVAGRVKTNGRGLLRSPVTPLLELELLRGAVNAKQGLWQTMAAYAGELGLDAEKYAGLAKDADAQHATLAELHAEVVDTALRPDDGIHN